jgi:enoyl-CoA hydratase/carnithine racemase
VEVGGPTATLVLDRPERRNAQTPAMWRELAAVRSALPADVRVVVVRAQGQSFSAGLDRRMFTPEGIPGEPSLAALADMPAADLDQTIAGYQRAFSWLRDPGLVTIAAVQGHAIGAGFQLALACDLRVLADDAQLAMRETVLGLVPDLGGTGPLVECLGYARALELCVSGRSMGAQEAVASGLALRAVPTAELDAAVGQLVSTVLAAPFGSVAETKALLMGAPWRPAAEQLAAERAAQARRLVELARAWRPASAEGVPD